MLIISHPLLRHPQHHPNHRHAAKLYRTHRKLWIRRPPTRFRWRALCSDLPAGGKHSSRPLGRIVSQQVGLWVDHKVSRPTVDHKVNQWVGQQVGLRVDQQVDQQVDQWSTLSNRQRIALSFYKVSIYVLYSQPAKRPLRRRIVGPSESGWKHLLVSSPPGSSA